MTSVPARLRAAALLLTLAAIPVTLAGAAEAPALSTYNADIKASSVSGISSGAFMAVQLATAWSSTIVGVGVIAGGPFFCAQGSAYDFPLADVLRATGPCMTNEPVLRLPPLIAAADEFARVGDIDPLENLRNQRVFLFHGYNDAVVAHAVTNIARDFYLHYMQDANRGNIFYQDATGAGHSQVTLSYGEACEANRGDYIDRYGYDQAGILLQHIYGRLKPRNEEKLSGRIMAFDQSEFTAPYRPEDFSLSDTGYVYVPSACEQQQRCRVHIALHGCLQSAEIIGDHYVAHAGYNEWADTNNLIVLYPQTRPSPISPYNPKACWDWWGYTNSFYATRNPVSRQIGAIKGMLDRVTQNMRPASAGALANDPTPTGVAVTDSSDTAVALVWLAIPGASAYRVYHAAAGGNFVLAGSVTGPSFGDAGLKPATNYSYRVSAIMGQTEGPFSAVVSGATRPMPPRCDTPGSCPVLR